jgi:hypothetical protein
MNRRNLIVGGTGAAAALAGVAWQQMSSPGAGQAAGQAAPLDEATTAFWQASFAQRTGAGHGGLSWPAIGAELLGHLVPTLREGNA